MSVEIPDVYDDLVELLAASADSSLVLGFRLSDTKQERLDLLLDKNRDGTLTERERAELGTFEHVVRLLKARMLAKGQK